MKTYTVTDKPFEDKLTTTRGMVYTVVKSAGTDGITREKIAEKVDGLMVLSGAYHRLNDLVKEGFVSTSGATSYSRVTPKAWASEPESAKVETETLRLVRKPFKWQCPTCKRWVTEDISKQCSICRPPQWTTYVEETEA